MLHAKLVNHKRIIKTTILILCFMLFGMAASAAAAGGLDCALKDGLWGRGWAWIGGDGATICVAAYCQNMYVTPTPVPQPTAAPTSHPDPTPTPAALGEVPLKGQTKYVSCELRTTANNVEWYFTYRLGVDPAQKLPAGTADWEAFFISRAGQNCNPNRGFRGDINGRFVTACDPAAGGYGVYPRALEAGLAEAGIPFQTVYLDVTDGNAAQLKELFIKTFQDNQVLSLWVRQIVDAPISWEVDPETGERYPIATHEHAISGQVRLASDGSYVLRIIDPWPMYSGLEYDLSFDAALEWMANLGVYMLQVIG
ncbi:MAG: hypothetical protein ACYC6L_00690 [Anaerolineae bacterium]